MPDHHQQPRWWRLYLALPLSGVLFWLVQRAQPPDTMRSLLDLGALLVTFVYVESWYRANTVPLLHHPLTRDDAHPIDPAR